MNKRSSKGRESSCSGKKDILEALQGQGYEIGYTAVCN